MRNYLASIRLSAKYYATLDHICGGLVIVAIINVEFYNSSFLNYLQLSFFYNLKKN